MNKEYSGNEVKHYKTLSESFLDMQKLYGERPAVTVYDSDIPRQYSYHTFVEDVKTFARGLMELGLLGCHIAIAAENSYDWVAAFWAAGCTGGTTAAVDIDQTEEEMQSMADYADAQAVLISEEMISVFPEGVLFSDVWEAGKRQKDNHRIEACMSQVQESDYLAIIYTSGTTSTAKPVVLTHGNIMYNVFGAQQMVMPGEKIFLPLPLYHTYSLVCGAVNVLSSGRHMCINGNLKTMTRELTAFAPDMLIAVPMMVDTLLRVIHLEQEKAGKREAAKRAFQKYQKRRRWHLSGRIYKDASVREVTGERLKVIITGGAHLNETAGEEFQSYGIQVLQGYGITECSPLISVNQLHENKLGSVGRVLPGIQMKLIDGEIVVKGLSVFREYYKNPRLTLESLADGWFHTGDIGYIDKRGYLYICGRKKNLIVFSNGKKVVPEELENYIQKRPYVKEVMVYGANNGHAADEVKLSAIIYSDPQQTAGMDSFEVLEKIQQEIQEINRYLPLYKRIQAVKISETEFKKTSIKKVKRGDVRYER